ncbi:MAG TPA: response regulator [Caulobacteraceae bacterium]
MTVPGAALSERALVLAPLGRDAPVAAAILREAGIQPDICADLTALCAEIREGAGLVLVTEEALKTADLSQLASLMTAQEPWSDLPFILLTARGGGVERNPNATRLSATLGNVSFLERPFHPTTLVSVVRTALRGRRRQYEAREHLEELRRGEEALRRLNDELERRVAERTNELAKANRQLLAQIEERERAQTALRQAQRLEAVGQLTSGVAHDFNNLLTVVLGNIRQLDKTAADPAVKRRLAMMAQAAERGATLTGQLLAFSRRQKLEPKAVDLNETVERMRELLQSTMGGSIRIETVLQPQLWPALIDPTQIELVLLNLAINARDAMEVGGSLTVETANVILGQPQRPEEPPPGEYVMIAVSDTGSGMTDEVLAKAFEPFFTTKEVGKGSGLGLSQVYGLAKQSGGGVRIDTRLGEGTSIKLYLPRTGAYSAREPAAAGDTDAVSSGHRVILVVDDDSAVREITCGLLQDLGHRVIEAGSGGAALEALDRADGAVDLVVLDFAMPGMNGAEVAREVRKRRPDLPILFVTGYADTAVLSEAPEDEIVQKPFRGDELAAKVTALLGREREPGSNVVPLRART